jgi:hypothetical protein
MSIKWYAATETTGDDSALDMVPNPGAYTDLSTGDKCFALVGNLHLRIYEYNEASTETEDVFGLLVIPDGNVSGTGAWEQVRTSGIITTLAGSFANQIHGLVTESGGTVSLDFEGNGSIPGLGIWSDELVSVPIQSVELNAGTDDAPTANYVHILKADPVTLVTDTSWPATEHIKVAYVLIPSAAYVASDGAYVNQNWNDGNESNGMGHRTAMGENIRLTMDGAHWHSGVAANGATDGYITIDTGDTPDSAYFLSTAGVCFQMHRHTVPAVDTGNGSDMHVVNNYGVGNAYTAISDIRDIEVDAINGSLTNKYYNVVFWMVANKGGEYAPLMMNMPTGSYNGLQNAINDVDGFDVYDIPREFKEESTTGFLVCRITFRQTASAITVHNTTDLRGRTPGTASGTAITGSTEFADNQFKLYNILDDTKIVDLDLSGITTGNTRTIEIPDYDMIIPGGTIAGATKLYYAGVKTLETFLSAGNNQGGLKIFGESGTNTALFYIDDDQPRLHIRNEVDSSHFQIEGRDSASNITPLALFDPDGAATLYFDGVKNAETAAGGFLVYGSQSTYLGILHDGTNSRVYSSNHGNPLLLVAENTATGAGKTLFSGDPDGASELYHAGVNIAQTTANGWQVNGSGTNSFAINHQAGNTYLHSTQVSGVIHIIGTDSGSVQSNILVGNPDGAVELYFDGVKKFETTAAGATVTGNLIATGMDTVNGNEWTQQQGFNEVEITSTSNETAWNLATQQCAAIILIENTTVLEPINMQQGSTYQFRVWQSGAYTLAWDAVFSWGAQGVPIAPAANGDYVVFSFYCDGTNMIGAEFNRTEA